MCGICGICQVEKKKKNVGKNAELWCKHSAHRLRILSWTWQTCFIVWYFAFFCDMIRCVKLWGKQKIWYVRVRSDVQASIMSPVLPPDILIKKKMSDAKTWLSFYPASILKLVLDLKHHPLLHIQMSYVELEFGLWSHLKVFFFFFKSGGNVYVWEVISHIRVRWRNSVCSILCFLFCSFHCALIWQVDVYAGWMGPLFNKKWMNAGIYMNE